jgi:hypothetical protein
VGGFGFPTVAEGAKRWSRLTLIHYALVPSRHLTLSKLQLTSSKWRAAPAAFAAVCPNADPFGPRPPRSCRANRERRVEALVCKSFSLLTSFHVPT